MTATIEKPTPVNVAPASEATSKGSQTRTAVYIRKHGAPELLSVETEAVPQPKAGEVLIDVKATGVNFADVMARQGVYRDAPPAPFVPGYEVAGTIAALGEGVTEFAVGQKVMALCDFGGYASQVVAQTHGVFALEDGDDFVEAAAIPVNFVTAWHCIFRSFGLVPGDRALVHAAAGGVGLAAVQMLKSKGVEVFGTAGSEAKLEALRAHGVDHPINYRTEDFEAAIRKIAPEGIDLILDSIGGSYHKKGRRLLRPGGTLVAFGVASFNAQNGKRSYLSLLKGVLATGLINPLGHLMQSKGFVGANLKRLGDGHRSLLRYEMEQVIAGWRRGDWKPVISKTFPLAQAAEAHAFLQGRHSIGKVMLTV